MLRTDKKELICTRRWEDEDIERKGTKPCKCSERKGTKPVSVHRKGADSTREKVSRIYKRESENKNYKHITTLMLIFHS